MPTDCDALIYIFDIDRVHLVHQEPKDPLDLEDSRYAFYIVVDQLSTGQVRLDF